MIVPLIVCGGSGTRLWPASRASRPKQFLPLFGALSTFQLTLKRVADPALFGRPVIVTSRDHRFMAAEQLEEIGLAADLVLEPEARDSGPAILAGACFVAARDGGATLVLSLAADHMVRNVEGFVAAAEAAAAIGRTGRIVTFGIVPDRPATGFGYIEPGEPLPEGGSVVRRFVEKPDAAKAEFFVDQGFLWNSGNFLFPAQRLIDDYAAFEPETAAAVAEAVSGAEADLGFRLLDAAAFGRAAKRSIDHAVMEKSAHVAVVPASFDWSDVGSWSAVRELAVQDEAGNAATGRATFVNARGNMVSTDGPLVSVVGLDDLAVIATDDALLVARRDDEAGLKALVARLKTTDAQLTQTHSEVFRPWGRAKSLDLGPRYQVRRVVVKPGGALTLQKHHHRAEHWIVVRGAALVTLGADVRTVHENESIYIPQGAVHRLENPGKIDLEIIEVRTGSYLGEDDVKRLDEGAAATAP